ncbi:hypothetical protein PR048_012533 [Dryococelus australis]|uniref:Uncharacterized protein n=1 Tax=Dryococelus australis TaxID=614101 RepID=A0ABQ9HPL9_9NEOP|nr:hypothetical protein PR048_012533 [Dryococelus australis]
MDDSLASVLLQSLQSGTLFPRARYSQVAGWSPHSGIYERLRNCAYRRRPGITVMDCCSHVSAREPTSSFGVAVLPRDAGEIVRGHDQVAVRVIKVMRPGPSRLVQLAHAPFAPALVAPPLVDRQTHASAEHCAVRKEQHRNTREREMDYPEETRLRVASYRIDSHVRKCSTDPAGNLTWFVLLQQEQADVHVSKRQHFPGITICRLALAPVAAAFPAILAVLSPALAPGAVACVSFYKSPPPSHRVDVMTSNGLRLSTHITKYGLSTCSHITKLPACKQAVGIYITGAGNFTHTPIGRLDFLGAPHIRARKRPSCQSPAIPDGTKQMESHYAGLLRESIPVVTPSNWCRNCIVTRKLRAQKDVRILSEASQPECKCGGKGRYPRKLTDQRHSPARSPRVKIREWPGWGLNSSRLDGRRAYLVIRGAAVAERLACSPPTKTNRVQSPTGSLPDFRIMWGYSISPTLPLRRCSIFISITLIGSQDLVVKSCPNLFTHSRIDPSPYLFPPGAKVTRCLSGLAVVGAMLTCSSHPPTCSALNLLTSRKPPGRHVSTDDSRLEIHTMFLVVLCLLVPRTPQTLRASCCMEIVMKLFLRRREVRECTKAWFHLCPGPVDMNVVHQQQLRLEKTKDCEIQHVAEGTRAVAGTVPRLKRRVHTNTEVKPQT